VEGAPVEDLDAAQLPAPQPTHVEVKAVSCHVGAQDVAQARAATITVRMLAAATNALAKAVGIVAVLDAEELAADQPPAPTNANYMAPSVQHPASPPFTRSLCPRY